jgi:hypothetical protein
VNTQTGYLMGRLTDLFGIDVTPDNNDLWWFDGPSVAEAAAALSEPGLKIVVSPIPGQATAARAGSATGLVRRMTLPVLALVVLRHDPALGPAGHVLTSVGVPCAGLTPASLAEQVAVTVLLDQAGAFVLPSFFDAADNMQELIDANGGRAGLLDAAAMAVR